MGCQRAPVSGHAVIGTPGWSLPGAAAETQVVRQQRGGAGTVCAASARAGEAGAKPSGLLGAGLLQSRRARAGSPPPTHPPHPPPPPRTHPPPETQDKKQAER